MAFNTLKAVTNRLNSTPSSELHHQIGHLATSIAQCRAILSSSSPGSDNSLLIHKLKTKTSSLLQDRTAAGRLCGIILVKTLIENGGTPILTDSAVWARNLISCLNKPDSSESKRLCVIAITRLYFLTVDHQALVREVTTPTLPAFVSATLNIIKPTLTVSGSQNNRILSPLLDVVLSSWRCLTVSFGSTFRPNAASIKSICLSLISDHECSSRTQTLAIELLSRLHFCTPKGALPTEWSQYCNQVIGAAHDTADLVFRSIVEDWIVSVSRPSKLSRKQKSTSIVATSETDASGFGPWAGISTGCATIVSHIRLLTSLITNKHAQQITIPLAAIVELTGRLAAVTRPTSKFSLRAKAEFTKDEREELYLYLPKIHCAVIELYITFISTYGRLATGIVTSVMQQIWDIINSELDNPNVRCHIYTLLKVLFQKRIVQIHKRDADNWGALFRSCCQDLMSRCESPTPPSRNDFDLNFDKNPSSTTSISVELFDSARDLSTSLLNYDSLSLLPGYKALRTQLDRLSVFLQNREALLASILHPTQPKFDAGGQAACAPSLLPFLSRTLETSNSCLTDEVVQMATQALLHPRMPLLRDTENTALFVSNESPESPQDQLHFLHPQLSDHENQETEVDDAQIVVPTNEASASEPHLDGISQKRDFTALLEESTDAQLAGTALSGLDGGIQKTRNLEATEDVKRPRLEAGTDTLEGGIEITAKAPLSEATTSVESMHHAMRAHEDLQKSLPISVSTTVGAANGETSYDTDDTSDAEIPPIDATLAGMTDSEDEDGR